MTKTDADDATTGRRWIVPACAIAFAVLFLAGERSAEMAGGKLKDKTPEQILKTFHDGKGLAIASAWLLVLAGLAFIPLAWAATRRVSAGLSGLGEYVARASAQLFVAMVLVAAAVGGTLAVTVVFEPENDPPADLVRFLPLLSDSVIRIGGALAVAVFLTVVSRAGQKVSAVPAWFSVLGYVAAVAMLGAVFVFPIALLPIWALAAAFVLRK
jgi:hypothetical protein